MKMSFQSWKRIHVLLPNLLVLCFISNYYWKKLRNNNNIFVIGPFSLWRAHKIRLSTFENVEGLPIPQTATTITPNTPRTLSWSKVKTH